MKKNRTREDLIKEIENKGVTNSMLLEVLLDIRDLLKKNEK